MKKIVFSGTGRTMNITDVICSSWGDVDLIDLSLQNFKETTLEKDELCLIAAPCYVGRVPEPAVENMKKINGNGAKAVLVATFGNNGYFYTLAELKKLAVEQGFVPVCGIAALAQHSIATSVAKDKPDEADKAQLAAWGKTVLERHNAGTLPQDVNVPGEVPDEAPGRLPFHPKANKSCIKCGICAEKCPAGAIPKENPMLTDNKKCITCMRCMEICPTGSRTMLPPLRKVVDIILTTRWKKPKPNEFYMD